MYTSLAGLVYAAAIGIPVLLLYHFRAQAWYWHVLAIAASAAVGLTPNPPQYQTAGIDLLFGFLFLSLFSWGVGGLFVFRPHHEKHTHA